MSYDPTIGRFISQDPIAFEGGDANLYRYVGGGPTNDIDPNGLQAVAIARGPRIGAPAMPFNPANPALNPDNYMGKSRGI